MFSRRKEPQARDDQLQLFIEDARDFDGVEADGVPDMHVRTNAGERVFLCIQGASLIQLDRAAVESHEPDDAPAAPARPAQPVRYRFGATAQQTTGEDAPLDRGEFVVTTQRAVFLGTKQIRQWHWSKLVSVEHAAGSPWTAISVSNRPRTFGVLYDDEHQDQIRFSIDLAVANARGTRAALVSRLTEELDAARSLPEPAG